MSGISLHGRRRRCGVLSVVFLAGVLAAALEARGVILYSTATRNTDPPSVADGLDAWNLEATWGSYLATPIDATHFIAATHVGVQSATIYLNNQPYQVNISSGVNDPGSDLSIYTLSSTSPHFPTWAPLYNAAVDGEEIGKTMTVIGLGTQRGGSVLVGGVEKGWYWGDGDGVQSWGRNVVSGYSKFSSSSPNSQLVFAFNGAGIANESALSSGDSSGGVFIFSGGQWKLAGISYSIDSPFSLTGDANDAGFDADIYDARGLYIQNESGQWELVSGGSPAPGSGYASRISARLDWIQSTVPEPGTLVLLCCGGMALMLFRRFARRR